MSESFKDFFCACEGKLNTIYIPDSKIINTRIPSDSCGNFPLHYSIEKNCFHITKILLKNGADPNVRNYREFTPLHTAAWLGRFTSFKLLLKYKADINCKTDNKKTVLHLAAEGNRFKITSYILEKTRKNLINAKDDNKQTPLFQAVTEGASLKLVKKLVENGANVNVKNEDGENLIDMAEDENVQNYLMSLV